MKVKITIIALLLVQWASAQNFQGIATYKTHRKVKIEMKGATQSKMKVNGIDLSEQLKKMWQKTYRLDFTAGTSVYQQEKELSKNIPGVQVVLDASGSVKGMLYKDIKQRKFSNQKEFFGKLFLVKDSLPRYNWKLTDETKKIGAYTCYKAESTTTKIVDNIFGKVQKKDTITTHIEAWYTPQIPVSNGPAKYWGLPGLILEVNQGKQTIVCTEIVLNPKEKFAVEEPRKGKKMNQTDFEKMRREKIKEFAKRSNNNRKGKNKNSNTITFTL